MAMLIISPAAGKYLKKIKDKKLKGLFKDAIDEIVVDPNVGDAKVGDLAGTHENFYKELKKYWN